MRSNTLIIAIIFAVVFTFFTNYVQAAPGDLDPTFGNGGRVTSTKFFGNAVAIQSDGKIVAAGNGLERYNPDGSLDASFGSGGRAVIPGSEIRVGCGGSICHLLPGRATAVAVQADGKIIVAGSGVLDNDGDTYIGWLFAIERYNANGSLDSSFGTGGQVVSFDYVVEGGPRAVAIQSDGKIVAAGYKRDFSSWDFSTVRYNSNGTLDSTFGTGGLVITSFGGIVDEANDVAIQSDGKIVVAGCNRIGSFQTPPYIINFALARYNTDGSPDISFGTGGKVVTPFGDNSFGAKQIVIQPDGKFVAAGSGGDFPNSGFALTRYNTDGLLDPSFGTNGKVLTLFAPGYGGAGTVALQSDGKIVASGYGYQGTNSNLSLARYTADGSLDSSFGLGGKVFTPFGDISLGNDAAVQADGKIVVLASTTYPDPAYALFRYQGRAATSVANVEELYSAVNNPQNAASQINIAPGVYMLSVNDPNGVARPNGGRIELQENMSLQGLVGDRSAVVIDAANLPTSSFNNAPPITLTAAVRMGRGSNSIEWLTVRNATKGNANIGTDLPSTGTINIRVMHVASTNSQRGLDVRNFGAAMAGRVIEAEIADNDFYNNKNGLQGEGLRFVNNSGADGGSISATISGNRSYNNYLGLILEDNQSSNANISVVSSGDRFYENGNAAFVGGGLSAGSNFANGNTVSFTAVGTSFEDNNGFNNFDHGGLVISGGENTSIPNGTSNNNVNVILRSCRLANNQLYDLGAFGARSNPASIGLPGTNNRVKIKLINTRIPVLSTTNSVPDYPGGMNSVTVIGTPPFDFDNDGKTDISIFRPADGNWWWSRSSDSVVNAAHFGSSADKVVAADFTGDGQTDLAVWRPSTGQWFILRSEDGSFFAFPFGTNGDIPMPADYDGDGKADAAVFRPSSATWFILRSSDGQVTFTQFGANGDLPVASDYDGDGKADVAIFRPSGANGAEWWVQRSTAGLLALQFGSSTDKAVPGDYTGDGKSDIAFFRPSTGQWYILRSEDFSYFAFPWGANGDIAAPGDYDGDGKFDAAVFRPATSTWYVNRSTAGPLFVGFGNATDQPVPNAYVR